MEGLNHQIEALLRPTLPMDCSFFVSPPLHAPVPHFISPESQGNGHRSILCAWMSIRGQSFHWGRFHLGKRGFHGGCRVACAEPGTAGHAADTEHCSRPPSPRRCAPLERRCCGGWRRCSALSGWCGGGNSAPPTKVWRTFEQVFLIPKCDCYCAMPCPQLCSGITR